MASMPSGERQLGIEGNAQVPSLDCGSRKLTEASLGSQVRVGIDICPGVRSDGVTGTQEGLQASGTAPIDFH